jgi:hypothetical protein
MLKVKREKCGGKGSRKDNRYIKMEKICEKKDAENICTLPVDSIFWSFPFKTPLKSSLKIIN